MEREIETSKEFEVGGVRYLVTHPQVETAWEIGIDLLKLIGGSAASMAQAGGDAESAGKALTNAVTSLLAKVDHKTSMALVKRVLRHVEVQGTVGGDNKKLLLDDLGIKSHFHGRMGALMNVTGSAIAFTHADFFEAIVDGIATMMKKVSEKLA